PLRLNRHPSPLGSFDAYWTCTLRRSWSAWTTWRPRVSPARPWHTSATLRPVISPFSGISVGWRTPGRLWVRVAEGRMTGASSAAGPAGNHPNAAGLSLSSHPGRSPRASLLFFQALTISTRARPLGWGARVAQAGGLAWWG